VAIDADPGQSMIYELRSYVLASERFAEYVATFSERPAVVEVLRPYLRGFWSSESGILNRVMHLYEYRDRAERLAVRTARAQIPVMRGFYADVLPMLREQRSVIYEGKVAAASASRGGVYDRVAIALAPGVTRERSDRLAATLRDAFSTAFQVAVALESRWLEQPRAPAHELVFMLRSASLEERHRGAVDLSAAIGDSSVATVETDLWTPLAFSPLQ
jgi:NIPSNAP protein